MFTLIKRITKNTDRTSKNLYKSANNGDLELFKKCALQPFATRTTLEYCLYTAAEKGHLHIVKYLCCVKRINPSANNNRAPMAAVMGARYYVVQYFCNTMKVDYTANNRAIEIAAMNNDLRSLKLLCRQPNANPGANNNAALIYAASDSGLKYIDVFIYLCSLPKIDIFTNYDAIAHAVQHNPLAKAHLNKCIQKDRGVPIGRAMGSQDLPYNLATEVAHFLYKSNRTIPILQLVAACNMQKRKLMRKQPQKILPPTSSTTCCRLK